MKLTILTDNTTLIDRYYVGEPGFCAYMEDGGKKILFDLGYSDVFMRNARRMRLDLSALDYVGISHGHSDHTWGLESLLRHYSELEFEGLWHSRPVLLGHPETFTSIGAEGFSEIGSMLSADKLSRFFELRLSAEPQRITDRLYYLGQIPRLNDFEGRLSFGRKAGTAEPDSVLDDTALAYRADAGIVVITGCSHSGICNILEHAKRLLGESRILDVIGGLHLLNPGEDQMAKTLEYLKGQDLARMHPCHCTDFRSRARLSTVVPVEEVGVGLSLEFS